MDYTNNKINCKRIPDHDVDISGRITAIVKQRLDERIMYAA